MALSEISGTGTVGGPESGHRRELSGSRSRYAGEPHDRAALAYGMRRIVLAGGVAANSRLREKMKEKADADAIEVFFPSPKFCTDNGAMIALAGYHWLKRGRCDDFRLNADADLTL